jgi:hypothetical protein
LRAAGKAKRRTRWRRMVELKVCVVRKASTGWRKTNKRAEGRCGLAKRRTRERRVKRIWSRPADRTRHKAPAHRVGRYLSGPSKPRERPGAEIVLAKSEGQDSGGCDEIRKDEAGLACIASISENVTLKTCCRRKVSQKHSQVGWAGTLW